MSLRENELWAESKAEMFAEACERGDYPTALAIARDFKAEGFGNGLLEELRSMPLEKFTHPSFNAFQV